MLWLGITLLIVYSTQPRPRSLDLKEGEILAGFVAGSHELVTVTSRSPRVPRAESFPHYYADVDRPLPATSLPRDREHAWGTDLWLWDLDHHAARKLDLPGVSTISGVTPCRSCSRLCVFHDALTRRGRSEEAHLLVMDAHNNKPITDITWRDNSWLTWAISGNGETLVCHDAQYISCIDVNTGEKLCDFSEDASPLALSSDGRWLALSGRSFPGDLTMDLFRLPAQSELARAKRTGSVASSQSIKDPMFSPDGSMVTDGAGAAWDTKTLHRIPETKMAARSASSDGWWNQSLLVDHGRTLVRLEQTAKGFDLNWVATASGVEMPGPMVSLPGHQAWINYAGQSGEYVIASTHYRHGPLTPVERYCNWLGLTSVSPRDQVRKWYLVDSRSRSILRQGSNKILAVSDDGNLILTAEDHNPRISLHDRRQWWLPSLLLVGVWTFTLLCLIHYRQGRIRWLFLASKTSPLG